MGKLSINLSDQNKPDEIKRGHIVFISHTGFDYDFIERNIFPILNLCLLDYHAENSKTRDSPMVSELYRKAITRSLHRCGCCLVILSAATVTSEWVKYEVNQVLSVKMPLITVIVDQSKPNLLHADLSNHPSVIFTENNENAKNELASWLKENAGLQIT